MSSGTAAVLFDIDGTLVDSNYLHIHAWCRAFVRTVLGWSRGAYTGRSAWTGPSW